MFNISIQHAFECLIARIATWCRLSQQKCSFGKVFFER